MCGGTQRSRLYRLGTFAVVRCSACGFRYLSPRLTEASMLEVYRSGAYFEGGEVGYDSYAGQAPALRATFRRVVADMVKAGFGGGDLLEIGCGYGFLLEEARSAFRSCSGTEFADEAASAARARGLDVVTGGIEALPPGRRFDCIVATHVIEHVYDPRGFIGAVKLLLRPGGTLLLGTPDMGSLWRRTMGARWPSFKVPEHVLYFDRPSLTGLLADSGFERVQPFPYARTRSRSRSSRRSWVSMPWGAARPVWDRCRSGCRPRPSRCQEDSLPTPTTDGCAVSTVTRGATEMRSAR